MRYSLVVIAFLCLCNHVGFSADGANLNVEFEKEIRPTLVKFCGDCHNKDKDVPFLKANTLREINAYRSVWRSAVGQLRNRTMPPADEKTQPAETERLRLSSWLESALRKTAATMGDYAGAPISRRINRLEYDNTIRDLFGLELNFSETFPTEGSGGEGFSNNGETLFLPAILMERYLEAAQQILDTAIITPPLKIAFAPGDFVRISGTPKDDFKNGRLTQTDEAAAAIGIFVTSDYELSINARSDENSDATIAVKIDGIAANRFSFTGAENQKPGNAILRLQRGVHTFSVCGEKGTAVLARFELNEKQKPITDIRRNAHLKIIGERDAAAFAAMTVEARRTEARKILGDFAACAYRRPLRPGELDRLLSLFDRSAQRNDPFEESVKLALKAVLVSSHFLFRTETDSEKSGIYPLNDFELATRLSYFLWASLPDAELMKLAAEKKLNRPEVLAAQVDRMLDAPLTNKRLKAASFIDDFTGQWLGTKEVGASVAFTNEKFKGIYTSDLADELRTEPTLLMEYLVAGNRSLLECISSDYIFATERTAKHYGIDGVTGKEFRRVETSDGRRGGMLGLGAVHMITSYPDRTSVVLRGAWVLETMLGVKVPNPPPDVPPLNAAKKKQKSGSLRAALELHRANPTCATCHNLIDPIGFGMENFDLLGRWRDTEDKLPIDSSGVMPTGEKFNGPAELKQILLGRKGEFARHITTKMMGYALGRSLEDRDDAAIEKIVASLDHDGFRARTLIKEIVLSTPFRNRQGGEAPKKNATPKPKKKELPAAKEK